MPATWPCCPLLRNNPLPSVSCGGLFCWQKKNQFFRSAERASVPALSTVRLTHHSGPLRRHGGHTTITPLTAPQLPLAASGITGCRVIFSARLGALSRFMRLPSPDRQKTDIRKAFPFERGAAPPCECRVRFQIYHRKILQNFFRKFLKKRLTFRRLPRIIANVAERKR